MNQPVMAGAPQLVSIGVASGPLCTGGANVRRLIITAMSNGQVTIWPVSPVVLGQGININQGTLPLVMRYEDWGDLIRGQWYAIGSVAGTIGVVTIQDCGAVANDLAELGRLR
jgi:hypothetical protein